MGHLGQRRPKAQQTRQRQVVAGRGDTADAEEKGCLVLRLTTSFVLSNVRSPNADFFVTADIKSIVSTYYPFHYLLRHHLHPAEREQLLSKVLGKTCRDVFRRQSIRFPRRQWVMSTLMRYHYLRMGSL